MVIQKAFIYFANSELKLEIFDIHFVILFGFFYLTLQCFALYR